MPTSTSEAKSAFSSLRRIKEIEPKAAEPAGDGPRAGRPLKPGAKSRDPEFRSWTGYLKRDTVTEADYQLKRSRDSRDMSELVQELLARWVAEQKDSNGAGK